MELVRCRGWTEVPVKFFCKGNLQEAQMEEMKQLCNFIETNRQQDCVYFTQVVTHRAADLHILLRLVEKWEYYSPNKYDLFQKENLAVKSEAIAKKFYTMAHHLRLELALVALLENWLEKKDGSRFCCTHLDFGALYKLEAQDCLAIIFAYKAQ
jgi:hypothetical protein